VHAVIRTESCTSSDDLIANASPLMLGLGSQMTRRLPDGLKLPAMPAKLETMGRFASTVEFYSRYREPYPPAFFTNVAERSYVAFHSFTGPKPTCLVITLPK